MNTRFGIVAIASITVLALSVSASTSGFASDGSSRGQKSRAKKTSIKRVARGVTSGASLRGEVGLVGIKLYDFGSKLIAVYGNPTDIQEVGIGTGAVGPSGGGRTGAAPGGRQAGGGGGAGGGAGRGATTAPPDFVTNPGFDFGNDLLAQGRGAMTAPDDNAPQGGPAGAGGGGGGSKGAGGGAGGAGGTVVGGIQYTRWIYKRATSVYSFILDQYGKVVQIEAVGIQDSKVKTSRGVGFGAAFGTLVKTYGNPDKYVFGSDQLGLNYLVNNKVAFQLARLGPNKPLAVVGVVVAAGK